MAVAPTRLFTLPAIPPCWIVKVALLETPATVPRTSKVPALIVEVPKIWPPTPTVANPPSTPNVPPIKPVLASVPLVVAFPVMFPLLVKVPAFANEVTVPLFVAVAPPRLFTLPAIPSCWMVKAALFVTPPTEPSTTSVPVEMVVPPVCAAFPERVSVSLPSLVREYPPEMLPEILRLAVLAAKVWLAPRAISSPKVCV